MKIIARGAEAILLKNKDFLIKKRVKKGYRHPILDKTIRKRRTKREARILEKISKIVSVPKIRKVEEYIIEMSFLDGKLLSDNLNSFSTKKQTEIAKKLGREVGKLHEINIIHGDLTTSNMILKGNKIFLFDFGLAFHSTKIEDRAVDIHLLKEALNSKHFKISEKFFKEFTKSYIKYQKGNEVLSRLEEVEKRGRYKRKGML